MVWGTPRVFFVGKKEKSILLYEILCKEEEKKKLEKNLKPDPTKGKTH